MDRMEAALARLSHGWEEAREVVESLHSLMMIREVGLMEADTLARVLVVSCQTMQVEARQEAADTKVAAHLVPVVGL